MSEVTVMNVSLYGICVHTAISAELKGHKEVDGDNWKSVADEQLVYNKILSKREVLKLNETPIGFDIEDNPYNFDGSEEIESIIRINYANQSSDVSRFSGTGQTSTWDNCDKANYVIEHTLVWCDESNATIIYYNDDIETVVLTIMNLFNEIEFCDADI